MDLIARMQATQKTVNAFQGKPFEDGRYDCVQLVRRQARNLRRPIKVPRYSGVTGAAAVLRELGFATLGEAMDHYFTRIRLDQILLGDIVEMPGQNGFSSLAVAVGNGRVIGYHEDVPHADILQPLIMTGAWRIGG